MKNRVLTLIIIMGILFSACKSAVEPVPESTDTLPPPPTETTSPTATSTALPPTATPTERPPTFEEIGEGIASEVGEVKATYEGDSDKVVYLFAEDHASIGGRLEIAIMLNRLYARLGTRHVGLEGWMASDPPMDLSWAHRPPPYEPGNPVTAREDTLVYMVKDGEFNSAEFLGLVYEDVVVHGVDDPELYGVTMDPQLWNTPYDYNYQIALAMMSDEDYDTWYGLTIEEKYQEAYDFALESVPYAQDMLERFREKTSAEDYALLLDELKTELEKWAEEYGNPIPPQQVENMANLRAYIDVVIQRSEAMAATILSLVEANPNAPFALSTGLMHADQILALLEEAGVSYVYIWPHALTLDEDPTRMSGEAYQFKEVGESPGEEGTIGAMLREGRNPPPTGEKERTRDEQFLREVLQTLLVFTVLTDMPSDAGEVIEFTEGEKQLIWEMLIQDKNWGESDILKTTGIRAYPIRMGRSENHLTLEVMVMLPNGSQQIVVLIDRLDDSGYNIDKPALGLEELLMNARYEAYEPEKVESPPETEGREWHQNCSNTWYSTETTG